METVNSLSGGKTSSYIAANYPADYNLFALVCIDCHNAGGKIDKKIKQMVNDKLQKYSRHWPEFVATSEDPKILKAMFDLEQMIGKEIIWLRGMGWEAAIDFQHSIPNMFKRWCTEFFKIQPIFEFLYTYTELPVIMNIGFRYDEKERAENFTTSFKYTDRCEYRPKSNTWIHRWKEKEWRVGNFPLITDKIIHPIIQKYWANKGIDFPLDSNCQNCFWKDEQQLRKNFETNNPIMQWSKVMEAMADYTFKDMSMLQIEKLSIQQEFFFGTGAGCQAGFCTD